MRCQTMADKKALLWKFDHTEECGRMFHEVSPGMQAVRVRFVSALCLTCRASYCFIKMSSVCVVYLLILWRYVGIIDQVTLS